MINMIINTIQCKHEYYYSGIKPVKFRSQIKRKNIFAKRQKKLPRRLYGVKVEAGGKEVK